MLSKGQVKIGDFGFAKKKYKALKISSTVETPLYMSLKSSNHNLTHQNATFGLLDSFFYEMIHGTTPWCARS